MPYGHRAARFSTKLQVSHRLASDVAQLILRRNLNAAAVAREIEIDPSALYAFLSGVPWGAARLGRLQDWLERFTQGAVEETHLTALKQTPRRLGES